MVISVVSHHLQVIVHLSELRPPLVTGNPIVLLTKDSLLLKISRIGAGSSDHPSVFVYPHTHSHLVTAQQRWTVT